MTNCGRSLLRCGRLGAPALQSPRPLPHRPLGVRYSSRFNVKAFAFSLFAMGDRTLLHRSYMHLISQRLRAR